MNTVRFLLLLAGIGLSGCAALPTPQAPQTPQPPPVASDNNAVIDLVRRARADVSAGRLPDAADKLERALRIEPRNAAVWHELARVSLHQGKAAAAADFAIKSNTYALDNALLRAANWRLIGQARTQNGDHAGAEDAFAKAAQLERQN